MADSKASASDWEPPRPEDLQRMLPQYEITGIIGRGGMGAVYKGRQAKLNRTVAIKVLPETFSQGEDELNFVARFEQEAQAMAGLDHPAIISVFDFGETTEGQLYFVMEFVDGMDIHQYLNHHGGKLPQEHALSITAHVLDALDYAHSRGIIHRDIKPPNILLNREGRVKIADFGLAKKFGDLADDSSPALTMTDVAIGTPDFVAPEALESGRPADHRADLYAVGVMLYQMLTGKLPRGNFQRPSELLPEIDPRLDNIVSHALESDPDRRYASAAALRADLDAILSQPMTRLEPGAGSDAVPAAVPVTLSVTGGAKRAKPVSAKGGNAGLMVGITVAATVVIGYAAYWAFGLKEDGGSETGKGSNTEIAEERTTKTPAPSALPTLAKSDDPPPVPPIAPPTAASAAKTPDPANPAVSSVAKGDPMPTPKDSVTITESPASPPANDSGTVSEPPTPTGTSALLTSLPGLKTRLDGYLAARRTQIGDLAGKYLGGLDARLNQAADAGDLKLVTAFDEEKTRVEVLLKILAIQPADPLTAPFDPATVTLPDLPASSPEGLIALRQTWSAESEKIRVNLDSALEQSLQALEAELTRAREFEKAKAVLAYREPLAAPVPGVGVAGQAPGSPAEPTKDVRPAAAAAAPQPDPVLARATKDQPFENTLGMKFVPVPDTDLLFCIHEVRSKDYKAFATEAPGIAKPWQNQTHDGFETTDRPEDHPVVFVSWVDVQAFCEWLSQKEGKTYRLPTDREWSIAVGVAREEKWTADTTPETISKSLDSLPWGRRWPPPRGSGNFSDESRKAKANATAPIFDGYDDGFPTTAPVMSFEPNKLGLYDLAGNVWEWCEDWFSNRETARVLRGGSWRDHERSHLLSSYRFRHTPTDRNLSSGFRIVVEIAAKPTSPIITDTPPAPGGNPLVAPGAVPSSAAKPGTTDPLLAGATKDQPFENTLGMKFVPVPDTDVLFCIHEVRGKDYKAYASEVPGIADSWLNQTHDGFKITDRPEDHPVVYVGWEDARAFCAWLSAKEGRTYRLPMDREWSVAVGIGRKEKWTEDTTPETVFKPEEDFPWGDQWPPPKGAGNYSDLTRKEKAPRADLKYSDDYDDGFPTTAPVMSFDPNNLGLFDLGGNVSEWCDDRYSSEGNEFVLRGSSWHFTGHSRLRSSARNRSSSGSPSPYTGFRIVVEIAAKPTSP